MKNTNNLANPQIPLPVDIVLGPSWWHKNEGITFDRDFFFHPDKRVESERRMEQILYDHWGRFGLGKDKDENRPEIGAVHLAAGYLLSESLGCEVEYKEDAPPTVHQAHRTSLDLDTDEAFTSSSFKAFLEMMDRLKSKYGFVSGDVNWSGILNLALDLYGEMIFIDFIEKPDQVNAYFNKLSGVIDQFVNRFQAQTGTSSISVNRNVRHFENPVFLHSECSHTMISVESYETFLQPFDIAWSRTHRPFGIHYCGTDPDRYAESFAKIPHLDFLDVGWGGDIKVLREHLPDTFLNIRLSPVDIIHQDTEEIRNIIFKLVRESNNPWLTGVCCVNMDDKVEDGKITAIFEAVSELREEVRQ